MSHFERVSDGHITEVKAKVSLRTEETDEEKWGRKFIGKIIASVLFLPFVMWAFPSAVPFSYFELWQTRGTIDQWLWAGLPVLIWGVSITAIQAFSSTNSPLVNRRAEDILIGGTATSIFAGVVEEITFRWLFFMNNIVSVKIANFFFFGFMGFGIAEFFHMHLIGPLVNFVTFGALTPWIYHATGWAVGASMIATNAFFRDGHKYQGFFGLINSWFGGLYLFWIMFHFGLPAAILVHFLYDFLIFAVLYVDAAIERAGGNC